MYDLIIIGAGPAGLTAALYALRARMNVLVIDSAGPGGQVMTIDRIENFPGFPENADGFSLIEKIEKQVKQFGFTLKMESVESLSRDDGWTVKTDEGLYRAIAVICATGASPRELGVPGEKELSGKGVSYCATCDGAFFKGKQIVVVGGGDTAVKEALFLTRLASRVTLVHRRDRLRAEKVMQERLLASSNTSFEWNSVVTRIEGAGLVEHIGLKNLKTNKEKLFPCAGVFVLVGITPKTSFLKSIVSCDEQGFVATNGHMETDQPGLFAAGDCRQQLLRQIITACGDGATAAFAAQHFVDTKLGTAYGEFKQG